MIPLLVKHLAYDEDKLKVLSEVSWVLAYLSARYVYCPTPRPGAVIIITYIVPY